ncbi:LuxR C-terminal-related transcriptional regulator [Kribbella sp. CA-253562]|uniref:LuxR C-terminal-related transcriptional regulator n=1 Tax=Kribbella sp. CA-253562 TaxID=3239942 RepID=UPI003D8EBD48
MVEQLTVTERDLRRIFDVIDRGRQSGPGEEFPREVLRALGELIPADDVSFQLSRPLERQVLALEEVTELPVDLPDGWEDLFWHSYWDEEICSRPQRTGDYESVWKTSDYLSARQLGRSPLGEWFRVLGTRSEICVPFPARGAEDRRMLLSRTSGRLFVAEGTVRKHLENIYERLGVASRTAAVATAFPLADSA